MNRASEQDDRADPKKDKKNKNKPKAENRQAGKVQANKSNDTSVGSRCELSDQGVVICYVT